MIAAWMPPIVFVGSAGTTGPADTVAVHASTLPGDLVIALAGHTDTTKTTLFDATTDMTAANNGTFEAGSGWSFATGPAMVFTPDSLQIHRMRTFTFRNARTVLAHNTPAFAASSTSCAFASITVPAALQGRAMILCASYSTSTNGGFAVPDATVWDVASSNALSSAMVTKRPVQSFAGATATFTNSVVHAKLIFVIG